MPSVPKNPSTEGKVYPSAQAAMEGIADGASVLVAGFAGCGIPEKLLRGLAETGVSGLTLICQGTWVPEPGTFGVADLVANGQLKKMVSPLPFHPEHGGPVQELWESGELELEVVPQGVLAERLRAGGAGIGGVFLRTGDGAGGCVGGMEIRGGSGLLHSPAVVL